MLFCKLKDFFKQRHAITSWTGANPMFPEPEGVERSPGVVLRLFSDFCKQVVCTDCLFNKCFSALAQDISPESVPEPEAFFDGHAEPGLIEPPGSAASIWGSSGFWVLFSFDPFASWLKEKGLTLWFKLHLLQLAGALRSQQDQSPFFFQPVCLVIFSGSGDFTTSVLKKSSQNGFPLKARNQIKGYWLQIQKAFWLLSFFQVPFLPLNMRALFSPLKI